MNVKKSISTHSARSYPSTCAGLIRLGAQRVLDRLRDGLDLTLVLARAQDEEIREGRRVPEIENDDVGRLLVERGLDRLRHILRKSFFTPCAPRFLLSLRHASDSPRDSRPYN